MASMPPSSRRPNFCATPLMWQHSTEKAARFQVFFYKNRRFIPICLSQDQELALSRCLNARQTVEPGSIQPALAFGRTCFDDEVAAALRMGETHDEIGFRQRSGATFGPLDDEQIASGREIAQAEPFELVGAGDAVQIEMVNRQIADRVRLDETVGRTLHARADADRTEQRA